jgi:phage portal protein BeeE
VEQRLLPEDIIHFRDGIDPWNVRKGISRFASLLREIATDDEAEKFSYAILKNMGVGGYVIQPDVSLFANNQMPAMNADEANKVADTFYRRTTGVNRGRPIVNSVPLKIDRLSWSPNEINMRDVHRIPEERICAVLGVPPGVAGLGAGLDRNTYNNAQTDEEKAYRRAILPMHRMISDALDQHLLPEFDQRAGICTGFDTRDVSALQ